ncbi:MAG: septal ring lytic transglycosylase RlpA family protein [Acidobacteriaceae bacterium]|nr:septal ring lytic transglycosylase RlpA family protein [Acidobacteriaceae bacterium]
MRNERGEVDIQQRRESRAVPHRFSNICFLAILCGIAIVSSCGRKHQHARVPSAPRPSSTASSQRRGTVPAVAIGYTEEGIASWYGVPYHGRPAADGEIYDMETLVAAHRVMPFNTWLKVTNVENRKTVNVRIIDRGPFVAGRILDLSKAAARHIDLLGPGVGRVRLEVIAAPADIPSNDFYAVQVGAFSVQANAERLRASYEERFGAARIVLKQGAVPLWRVLVGKEPSMAAARELAKVIAREGKSVFVVRVDETIIPPAANPPVASEQGQSVPAAQEQTQGER